MESRNEKDHTVELSPELVAMLDKRQRDWGTNSRGEVVEMLLGWMKKDSLSWDPSISKLFGCQTDSWFWYFYWINALCPNHAGGKSMSPIVGAIGQLLLRHLGNGHMRMAARTSLTFADSFCCCHRLGDLWFYSNQRAKRLRGHSM